MSDYFAKKIDHDFSVDGVVTKEICQQATWSATFVDMGSGEQAEFTTRSAILWSETHLYVAFQAEEPDLQASLTERDSLIFLENDLELFIDGRDAYYELEVNALNTVYEVFFIWRDAFSKGTKFPPETFDISHPDVYTFGGDYDRSDLDEGWSLEIAIPWESLVYLADGRSLPPQDGDIWKIFLGRFQKKIVNGREISPHPASSLRSHGVYDTHLPEEWSEISFVV